MIRRFVIKNFKRFREETVVSLEPVTVLVGANNSGKSTLLQALNLFQNCIETTRQRENGNGPHGDTNGQIVLKKRTVSLDEVLAKYRAS
jgi:AAA15 family ATPase/GTPase